MSTYFIPKNSVNESNRSVVYQNFVVIREDSNGLYYKDKILTELDERQKIKLDEALEEMNE